MERISRKDQMACDPKATRIATVGLEGTCKEVIFLYMHDSILIRLDL